MQEKKHLFICGCPRSGTGALWRLMSGHQKIAVGLERYISRCIPNFTIDPSLFIKNRFFDLQSGDTHQKELTPQDAYYDMQNRWNECEWVGDKIPLLSSKYADLFAAFPNAHVLYIYRNIFDVANSHDKWFKQGKWKRNSEYAVKIWNISLRMTLSYKKKGFPIYCISYEDLFFGDYEINSFLTPLGLNTCSDFQKRYEEVKDRSQLLEKDRKVNLTSLQKKYLIQNADIAAYRWIATKKDKFLN